MNTIKIRNAVERDAQIIAGFNCAMALETENKVLHNATVNRGVRRVFHTPQYGFYLVAEMTDTSDTEPKTTDTTPVACLTITYEWSDWRDGLFWWIQSVYVEPTARRHGVFKSLYQFVHQRASEQDEVCGIRLYVEQDNQRAQKTYTALGMQKTGYHLYATDFHTPTKTDK